MGDGLFWWIVLPMMVAALVVYLAILAVGAGTIRIALKSTRLTTRALLLAMGLSVIASPILYHIGMDALAGQRADRRQEELAGQERIDLAGRLPRQFITVGNFRPELVDFIASQYGIGMFPEAENARLVEAYRLHRRAQLCRRRFGGESVPGTALPKCRSTAVSAQAALNISEPVLVFAEGRHTSLREDNVIAGAIYEIRLVTPREDLLVAYFEERTVKGTVSVFNPYAPPRRRASQELVPTLKEFIETAMQGASR